MLARTFESHLIFSWSPFYSFFRYPRIIAYLVDIPLPFLRNWPGKGFLATTCLLFFIYMICWLLFLFGWTSPRHIVVLDPYLGHAIYEMRAWCDCSRDSSDHTIQLQQEGCTRMLPVLLSFLNLVILYKARTVTCSRNLSSSQC